MRGGRRVVQMMGGHWQGGAFVKREAGGAVWAESESELPWLGFGLQEAEGGFMGS